MHSPAPSRLGGVAGALLVCLVIALAGCGQSTLSPAASDGSAACASEAPSASAQVTPAPSSVPAGEPDPVYAAIEEQVGQLRELAATEPVAIEVIDEATLGQMLTELQAEEQPAEIVEANERLYKALGLLPADADLGAMTSELLTAGVLGFYRDDVDKLFVVSRSGEVGGLEKITFAHEYTHALQDRHFPVFAEQQGLVESDRLLARQAVYEGDASLAMTHWAFNNLSPEELLQAAEINPDQQAVIDSMPAILRDTLTYPYTTGLFFVSAGQSSGGWAAVDAMYERMPESTEQILHPEKYQSGEAPVAVAMPPCLDAVLGDGWSVALEDTFGELQTGIWLREGGASAPLDAAAGWGGDRLAVLNGPDGAWAVVLQTAWDTDAEATEFETAATTALAMAGGSGAVLPGVGGSTRWVVIGSDDAVRGQVANALGLAG